MVVTWIRSRAAKRAEEAKRRCTGCRCELAGEHDEQLRTSGAVLLEGVGWFCGPRCERQYRLRFRIQPAATPSAGNPRASPAPRSSTPTASTPTASTPTVEGAEPAAPKRRSAQEELAAALLARRQKYFSGV